MDGDARRRSGFTSPELLWVLMILAVGSVSILPSTSAIRQIADQEAALLWLSTIASQEEIFRSTDADGDGVDDYGSLAELVTAGLVPGALGDGEEQGYVFPVTTGPGPFFDARANPLSCHTGVLRLYVDPSGVVRYDPKHPSGPGDPPLPPGGEQETPQTAEQVACAQAIDAEIGETVMSALGLTADATLAQAMDLAATPGVVDSLLTHLDGDADEQLTPGEYLGGDWLAVARAVAAELGETGPPVGSDSDLTALLESHQASLTAQLDLDLDAPQPSVALLDLYGQQDGVVAYFASLMPSVPALGPAGLTALAGTLALVALLARAVRT